MSVKLKYSKDQVGEWYQGIVWYDGELKGSKWKYLVLYKKIGNISWMAFLTTGDKTSSPEISPVYFEYENQKLYWKPESTNKDKYVVTSNVEDAVFLLERILDIKIILE